MGKFEELAGKFGRERNLAGKSVILAGRIGGVAVNFVVLAGRIRRTDVGMLSLIHI